MTDVVITGAGGRALSRKGVETRQRLLDAAEEVFAELGYHDASIVKVTEAAGVAPVYRALQILIPIACAPLLFGERWPADAGARSLLAGGLLLTLAGIVLVSYRHDRVVQAPAGAAS